MIQRHADRHRRRERGREKEGTRGEERERERERERGNGQRVRHQVSRFGRAAGRKCSLCVLPRATPVERMCISFVRVSAALSITANLGVMVQGYHTPHLRHSAKFMNELSFGCVRVL